VEIREAVYQRFILKQNKSTWQHCRNTENHSYIAESSPGFGIVARAARPVTGQGSGRPEQRKQKKHLAPWDT